MVTEDRNGRAVSKKHGYREHKYSLQVYRVGALQSNMADYVEILDAIGGINTSLVVYNAGVSPHVAPSHLLIQNVPLRSTNEQL